MGFSQGQAGVSWVGKGLTYLPPLLVLHPLSIHDTYCEERRKNVLTHQTGQEEGGTPEWRALEGQDPQETRAQGAVLGLRGLVSLGNGA